MIWLDTFLHLGMPKTLTSALQKEFYPKHKEIYYLGIGNDRLIDYIDDDVNFIFETLLLYANSCYYNEHKNGAKEIIRAHYKKAVNKKFKAFGLSLEWLSFNFTPDMNDEEIKVKRLLDLFGQETKIILFIRNQRDLLRSLYKEYIKIGLPFSYPQFVEYIHDFKDRNFYFDLLYDKKYELYNKYFKEENIYFLPLEKFRDRNKKLIIENDKILLIKKLCNILNLKYPDNFSLPKTNKSLNDVETANKLELNRRYRHDFGNLIFEHANIHRSRKFFEKEKVFGIDDYFKDIKIKRLLLNQAKNYPTTNKEIDYKINNKLASILKKEFIESNKKLRVSNQKIELPEIYYDIKLS